ncbi:ribosomal protein S5 domain 2-type protein [Mycena pura]|uniref:Ribosomal protein S5 domain 2-type protein n=1 Tax=Mycena pura TaxID=153505 RepID=A0AAD6VRK0_9AGAR|nr:ribosomal protein S5 domain 2-type protein [Mycena pura]
MRPPSPSIPEKEFLFVALKQSLRLDGRLPLEMRVPTLTFGPELGYYSRRSKQKWSNHRPSDRSRACSQYTRKYRLWPPASTKLVGSPSEEEITITRMLDKVLRRSDAVDKESLCILAGQRVWHLRLTLHCLSDAGNMLDCACLAGIVALKHFRRPDIEVTGDEVTIHPPSERAPIPLSMHHTPFCFTFAFFPDAETSPVLDPSQLEHRLSAGLMSIALNAQRELCVVQKLGGVPLGMDEILRLVDVAVRKAKELDQLVGERLKEDWLGRNVELL